MILYVGLGWALWFVRLLIVCLLSFGGLLAWLSGGYVGCYCVFSLLFAVAVDCTDWWFVFFSSVVVCYSL